MATNFTVILQRQHFGNEPDAFADVEPTVPFVGSTKSFSFDCQGVNPTETALLMFLSRDVDHPGNTLQVNGVDVSGGLPASPARDAWNSNILLIEPRHQLRPTGNVLHVASRNFGSENVDDLDDFIIDNVVIVYKTPEVPWILPSAAGDLAAFIKTELLPSITNVKGSGATADPDDQRNEYVLPTRSQLAGWRVVFKSLLAAFWPLAHLAARMISSTYNVVQFLDTPSGRTYYVLMEGVPGQIPAPATHASGVTIINPADPTRRGWGTYLFDASPQRAVEPRGPPPQR